MAIIIRPSMTKSGQRSSALIEDLTALVTWMKGETTLLSAANIWVTRYGQASVAMMNLLEMLLYPFISQSQERTAIAAIIGRGEVMTGENKCLLMSCHNSYITFSRRDQIIPSNPEVSLTLSIQVCSFAIMTPPISQIVNTKYFSCQKSFKINV